MNWENTLGKVGGAVAGGVGGYMSGQPQQRKPGPLMQYLTRPRKPNIQTGMPNTGTYRSPINYPEINAEYQPQEQMAQGGLVTKPTTALIGENGPEMVVPLTHRPDAKVGPGNALTPQMRYGR